MDAQTALRHCTPCSAAVAGALSPQLRCPRSAAAGRLRRCLCSPVWTLRDKALVHVEMGLNDGSLPRGAGSDHARQLVRAFGPLLLRLLADKVASVALAAMLVLPPLPPPPQYKHSYARGTSSGSRGKRPRAAAQALRIAGGPIRECDRCLASAQLASWCTACFILSRLERLGSCEPAWLPPARNPVRHCRGLRYCSLISGQEDLFELWRFCRRRCRH